MVVCNGCMVVRGGVGVLVMYHKMNTYQRRMCVCVKHMCVTVCACNEYGICMITWSNAIPPEPERVLIGVQ